MNYESRLERNYPKGALVRVPSIFHACADQLNMPSGELDAIISNHIVGTGFNRQQDAGIRIQFETDGTFLDVHDLIALECITVVGFTYVCAECQANFYSKLPYEANDLCKNCESALFEKLALEGREEWRSMPEVLDVEIF